MTYGALPIAYDEIMYLLSIKIEEEIMYEEIKCKILPNKELDLVDLSKEEVAILIGYNKLDRIRIDMLKTN